MREIEFRGRHIKQGAKVRIGDGKPCDAVWKYGWLSCQGKNRSVIVTTNIEKFPVESETVGQWTGIYDKNSTKIFEGDIVKHDNYGIVRVLFLQQECGYVYVLPKSDVRMGERNVGGFYEVDLGAEVIGNIHDNGELL